LIIIWSIWFLSLPFGEIHVNLSISLWGEIVPPITKLWKWWKREKKMHAWQWRGELGSDEIAIFLTLPWKMC
jgi:hypothetical protein